MNKEKLKNIGVTIAVAYTIVSLSSLVHEWIVRGYVTPTQSNMIQQFIITVMFVVLIEAFQIFDQIAPLKLLIIEVVVAETIVMSGLYIASFFLEIHPTGYRDLFITTLIPFIIGGAIFHIMIQHDIRQQNRLLAKINKK